MSWMKSPTALKTYSSEYGGESVFEDVFIGLSSDAGLYGFKTVSNSTRTISSQFLPSFSIDGMLFEVAPSLVNGRVCYSTEAGDYNLYYSAGYSAWVCAGSSVAIGSDPVEESVKIDGQWVYVGDDFYTSSYLPSSEGSTRSFTPRGCNRSSGTAKTCSYVFPRWTLGGSSDGCGVYTAVTASGTSGTKIIGLPQFNLSTNEKVVRSVEKVSGYFTYGKISYVSGKWVIGTVNSAVGWWEGSEPNINGSVTFAFKKLSGSTVTGSDITVTFDRYVLGTETQKCYVGDVAIWR